MLSALPKTTSDYQVISTVRIFAICSVVWGHCAIGTHIAAFQNGYSLGLQSFATQLGKMGTILFFIISGFLVSHKLATYTVLGFLQHRFKTTILPWMIFVVLLVSIIIINDKQLTSILLEGNQSEISTMAYRVFSSVIFYHTYWFVLVFIISMVILILFKHYILSPKMGLVLALFTLYYTVNLHFGWTSIHHTRAFLGYILFAWVGIYICKHYLVFTTWVNQKRWKILLPILAIAVAVACIEGDELTRIGCNDPYASIRLSNIFVTLVLFLCLFKAGRARFINRLIPDQIVYGIYLVHNILLYEQTILIKTYLHHSLVNHSTLFLLSMQLINFFFIMFTSIVIVKAFFNRKPIAAQLIKILTVNKSTRTKIAYTDNL